MPCAIPHPLAHAMHIGSIMDLPIKISFRGIAPSPALEAHARELALRLETVYDRIIRCEVVIEAPHRRHHKGSRYRVKLILSLPGGQLVVARDPGLDGAHEDAHVAVRDAFAAMRRRLEDHVQRLRGEVKIAARA